MGRTKLLLGPYPLTLLIPLKVILITYISLLAAALLLYNHSYDLPRSNYTLHRLYLAAYLDDSSSLLLPTS
jgi:hypothetical protein